MGRRLFSARANSTRLAVNGLAMTSKAQGISLSSNIRDSGNHPPVEIGRHVHICFFIFFFFFLNNLTGMGAGGISCREGSFRSGRLGRYRTLFTGCRREKDVAGRNVY